MGQSLGKKQQQNGDQEISKKLVNNPAESVTDSLKGYVLTHSNVKLLEGHNVVVRGDLESFRGSGKVAVITGGGSGHEPFAIGFVGRGALTASVVGGIFASPTSHTIINAINTCSSSPINDGDCRESGVYSSGDSRGCSDGALLVVTNYTGGGSGHEPAHIGYIGSGMLTGAVCGDIFTSPSSASILDTIQTCTKDGGSALLVVKNYTGDRLNFGKAAEVAKVNGANVEMVVVADDCALTSKDKSAGRRGLCGTIFIHKMAGAMSEEGKSLQEMTTFLRDAVKEIGTISISLSPCSIPGKPSNFTIGPDTVEFGLGIHGEAGVSEIKMGTAHDLVSKMLEHVRDSGYLPSIENKEVGLIVNNLGGTSNLELTIVAREAVQILTSNNVTVYRCYVGTFVTSMEMAGVSLTIMILNDERKKYLDAPCDAPAWTGNGLLNSIDDLTLPCVLKDSDGGAGENVDVKAEGNGVLVYHCLVSICESLLENEEKLNALDRNSGDGDTGTTFARAAKDIMSKLKDVEHVGYPINNESQLCLSLAKTLETSMGGSSGALLSLFLNAAANAFQGESSSAVKTFTDALKLGLDAIKKYGGAEEGDRTMIDALSPALTSLENSQEKESDLSETLKAASEAARGGAEATTEMRAKAGRASYTSEAHLTQPDPGAYAIALVFEAIDKAYNSKK